MIYIDDVTSIGSLCQGVDEANRMVREGFARLQLRTERSKEVRVGEGRALEALGLRWWRKGSLTVKAAMVVRLIKETEGLTARNWGSSPQVQTIIGRWMWPCLLCHCSLSEFSAIYDMAKLHRHDNVRQISPAQRRELEAVLDLLLMMDDELTLTELGSLGGEMV